MVHKSSILAAAIAVFWKVITMLSIKNAHEHGGLSRAGKSHLALLNMHLEREGKSSGHVIKYLLTELYQAEWENVWLSVVTAYFITLRKKLSNHLSLSISRYQYCFIKTDLI